MTTSRILSQGKNSQGKNQHSRVGKSASDDLSNLPTQLTPHAAAPMFNTADQALVDRWLAELSSNRYSTATIKSYRQALQPFCHIAMSNIPSFVTSPVSSCQTS